MDDDRQGTEHGMQAPARPISLDTAQCTITRREQARRATAEELIGLVAHDLRGYLTPLDGYIALLHMSAEREGRVRDAHHARAASASLANLARLARRLLTAHRLEHGPLVPEVQPIDLVAVIREAVSALAGSTALVRITAPERLRCAGDPDLLQEAVANLLTNALRHSPPDATVGVAVGVEREGTHATVQVSDHGLGIAPDLLPHLFERFTTGTGSTGLGLGLYLAREIARSHGGSLTVASTTGQGTTFCLALPIVPAMPTSRGRDLALDTEARYDRPTARIIEE